MSSIVYLFLAYAAAVLLIGGYVIHLVRRMAAVRERLDTTAQESARPPEDR